MAKHGRIDESQKAEMQSDSQKRSFRESIALDKWSKFDIVGADLKKLRESNPKKAGYIAHQLSMQESYLRETKKMRENVYSSAFGNSMRPEHFMKAVYIGTANSKRGDIFTEVSLASTDDALWYIHPTYEQSLRGATAGQRIYEKSYQYYAGEEYTGSIGTGNGALTSFTSAAMSPLPLIPFQTRILVNGALIAQDNGSGVLVGALLDPSATNTVVYSTGVITLNFLLAPANGAVIACVYKWNSEDANNYAQLGTVSLELVKTRWNARPMALGYKISDMAQIMFDTTGLGDAKGMITQAVGDEHAKSKDYRAIAFARSIALSNPVAYFDTDFATNGEISYKSWAQKILNEIGRVGAVLYDDIKRGQINKIVAGSKATEYLRLHDLWKEDTTDPRTGVYKAGNLGAIEVYCCPADAATVATDEMILTYKNEQEGLDTGIIFGTLTEVTAELRYPNFVTEGNIASIEDQKAINTRFIRLMKLQNL